MLLVPGARNGSAEGFRTKRDVPAVGVTLDLNGLFPSWLVPDTWMEENRPIGRDGMSDVVTERALPANGGAPALLGMGGCDARRTMGVLRACGDNA